MKKRDDDPPPNPPSLSLVPRELDWIDKLTPEEVLEICGPSWADAQGWTENGQQQEPPTRGKVR